MNITNIHDLPQQFVDLAEQEYHQAPNEYRVTQLLKGLRRYHRGSSQAGY